MAQPVALAAIARVRSWGCSRAHGQDSTKPKQVAEFASLPPPKSHTLFGCCVARASDVKLNFWIVCTRCSGYSKATVDPCENTRSGGVCCSSCSLIQPQPQPRASGSSERFTRSSPTPLSTSVECS